jgi:hypothetical protein
MKLKSLFFFLFCLSFLFFILYISFIRAQVSGTYYGSTDFFKFYESVRYFFSGQNLYSPIMLEPSKKMIAAAINTSGNLNPPFLTLILLPLYYFNYQYALINWTMISIFLMFISVILVLRPYKPWQKYTLPILIAFALYTPNSMNLACGQINNYLLILLVGSWLCARKQKDISAGVLLGIACALKFFFGLFLIYFLCIKRFKLITSMLITGIIAFLFSIFIFGSESYQQYHMTLQKINWYGESWNASFLGFFTRVAPPFANIITIIFSSLLFFSLIYAWKKYGEKDFDIGFSLTIIAMLLLSPLGWIYYFGLLIIPYLVLIHRSQNYAMHLIGCILLFLSSLSGDLLKTWEIKTPLQIFFLGGVGFYSLIALLGLYIFMMRSKFKKSDTGIITEIHWFVIYSIALIPSFISFFSLIHHLKIL